MEDFLNFILFRKLRARWLMKKWLRCMESEFAEEFLETLLKLMSLVFLVNYGDFRRNIEGFNGRYLFKSRDGSITVSAVFRDNRMRVSERLIDNPDITIEFRNGRVLLNYLISPKPDILGSMLRQDVTPRGNLNYLYKFAYMAKRLQLMATGSV
ncbi:MAG: hypothetical protein GXP46_08750 [Deferribacteres bacterium]|nr:hypothetical protein [Deferribacteres bacterium]